MSTETATTNLALLLEGLDIPTSAYQKAENRYKDLGEFFSGPMARCAAFNPHIYPQGSFRLGTVVRPLGTDDEYDLDVGCRLTTGITKGLHTQESVKKLLGDDLQTYRRARGIEKTMEEKRRCWRLRYKDDVTFHMDVVPSIPEDDQRRVELREAIVASGGERSLAASVASHTGAVTDNENRNYLVLSPDWRISNSEGYAMWFESRMLLARTLLERQAVLAKTTIADLPSRRWNSPLQEAIRVLKRHRDIMFNDNDDAKPISVIITTLAARAYNGESDLNTVLAGVLARMGDQLGAHAPRVPNPVNPKEDFADKWSEPKYAHLQLERNFHLWLQQARADFAILQQADPELLVEQAAVKFGATLDREHVRKLRGSATQPSAPSRPAIITAPAAKPWSQR
jgi:hypothetical protein